MCFPLGLLIGCMLTWAVLSPSAQASTAADERDGEASTLGSILGSGVVAVLAAVVVWVAALVVLTKAGFTDRLVDVAKAGMNELGAVLSAILRTLTLGAVG